MSMADPVSRHRRRSSASIIRTCSPPWVTARQTSRRGMRGACCEKRDTHERSGAHHMKTAAQALADFATTLQFDEIPAAVVERAKDCMIDTVAVCTYCSTLASSKIVIDYAAQ